MCEEDRIVVPDAAIKQYNDKYAARISKSIALATVKTKPCAPNDGYKITSYVIDEDAMYLQAMGLSTEEVDSGFKSSK